MKPIRQIGGVGKREKAIGKRWIGGFGDYFFVVMLALLTGPEKTPAEIDRAFFISFENGSKYIFIVEKKQQVEFLVDHLISFSLGQF